MRENERMKLMIGKEGENERNKPKMCLLREVRYFEKEEMKYSEKGLLRIMKAVRFLKIVDRPIMLTLAACGKSIVT